MAYTYSSITKHNLLKSLKTQVVATQTEPASLSLQVMNAKLEVNNIRNDIDNSTHTANHYRLGPQSIAPTVQPITQSISHSPSCSDLRNTTMQMMPSYRLNHTIQPLKIQILKLDV
jgi:hypothetical protein